MKIQVANQSFNLTKSHFISQGGEGSVYVVNNVAYKVYHDRSNLIPIAKISELSQIQDDYVIKPLEVIYNRNRPIGYSMKYVANTHPLCKLFTRAFKQRNSLELSDISRLIERMRDSVYSIHKQNILMVDCNELNFLVSNDFKSVYFIDTDSYQTPSFSATAIMDSIRDRHAQGFNKRSDWFSWAIVTFQMFTGIHPYRGKHPRLKNLEERMKANISVFNSSVSMPKTVTSLTAIPYAFRVWYENLFEKGVRCSPPGREVSIITIDSLGHKVDFIENMNVFELTLTKTVKDNITRIDYSGSSEIVWTTQKIYKGNTEIKAPLDCHPYADTTGNYLAWLNQGTLQLMDLQTKSVDPLNIQGTSLMSRDGRLYIHNGDKVSELLKGPKNSHVSNVIAQVLPHATYMFPGVILQNFLGSWYANLPYGPGLSAQIAIHQIPKNSRIISAKSEGQVLAITFFYQGFYHRKILVYDKFWNSADEWDELNVQNFEPNFTVLANGICAYLNDKSELEIFKAKFGESKQRRILKDSKLSHDLRFFSLGKVAKFFQGNQVFTITMK